MKLIQVRTIEEFSDFVIIASANNAEWDVKDFMSKINNAIVGTLKDGQMVSSDVMVAYFKLYSLLKNKASRERIRASALAVKTWVQENK
jgi:hypothetical protein